MSAVDLNVVALAEDDAILNDILSRWHSWAADERTAAGYPTVSPGTADYRTSRQWDWVNGAHDQDVENVIMAGVDGCINAVPQPFRNALQINARNLCTGVSVWRSPRLPADDMARLQLLQQARAMLMRELCDRNLI